MQSIVTDAVLGARLTVVKRYQEALRRGRPRATAEAGSTPQHEKRKQKSPPWQACRGGLFLSEWHKPFSVILETTPEHLLRWLQQHYGHKPRTRSHPEGKHCAFRLQLQHSQYCVGFEGSVSGSSWRPDVFWFEILPLSDGRTEVVPYSSDEQWLFILMKELLEFPRRWPDAEPQVLAYIEHLCVVFRELPADSSRIQGVSRSVELLWEAVDLWPAAGLLMLRQFPELADEFCLNLYHALHPGADELSEASKAGICAKGWRYWAARAGLHVEPAESGARTPDKQSVPDSTRYSSGASDSGIDKDEVQYRRPNAGPSVDNGELRPDSESERGTTRVQFTVDASAEDFLGWLRGFIHDAVTVSQDVASKDGVRRSLVLRCLGPIRYWVPRPHISIRGGLFINQHGKAKCWDLGAVIQVEASDLSSSRAEVTAYCQHDAMLPFLRGLLHAIAKRYTEARPQLILYLEGPLVEWESRVVGFDYIPRSTLSASFDPKRAAAEREELREWLAVHGLAATDSDLREVLRGLAPSSLKAADGVEEDGDADEGATRIPNPNDEADRSKPGAPPMEGRPDWPMKCDAARRYQQLMAAGKHTSEGAATLVDLSYTTVQRVLRRMRKLGVQ